ncbi:MAG: 50S ribosomal protein L28 [Candidatus Doudnabacteria bacterium]|nr:50S ribosomal protein L28 [Candidatus Doudnabacteria bacterium]
MARIDQITGKKTTAGKNRRHQRGSAGGVSGAWSRKAPATNRTFRPNLIKVRVLVGKTPKRIRISAKTLKRLKRDGNIGDVTLAAAKA